MNFAMKWADIVFFLIMHPFNCIPPLDLQMDGDLNSRKTEVHPGGG